MALTVAKVFETVIGDRRLHVYDITGDNSYSATPGEALTKNDLGFADTADDEFHVQVELSTSGYPGYYDITNEAFIARWVDTSVDGAPLAEIAATTNLSAETWRVTAYGRYQL